MTSAGSTASCTSTADDVDTYEVFETELGSPSPTLGTPVPLIPGRPIH